MSYSVKCYKMNLLFIALCCNELYNYVQKTLPAGMMRKMSYKINKSSHRLGSHTHIKLSFFIYCLVLPFGVRLAVHKLPPLISIESLPLCLCEPASPPFHYFRNCILPQFFWPTSWQLALLFTF